MKHRLLILAAILLICPVAAQAATQAALNQDVAVYSGPGYEFSTELGVWPYSTPVSVITVVEDNSGIKWAHIEFADGGELYRGYAELSFMTAYGSLNDWQERYRGEDAFMLSDATVYYGPGPGYVSRSVRIRQDTSVSICDYENGYALIEYLRNGLMIRGYVESGLVMTERERDSTDENWQDPPENEVVPVTPTQEPVPYNTYSDSPYDMGVPYLSGRSYGPDQMNIYIFWVQTQLKAAGYFQGNNWDVTGNLGSQTQKEIQRFMNDHGRRGHNGYVDQSVVDSLANYLSGRIVPVYIGGYYDYMQPLFYDTSICGMNKLVSNMRDEVPRVTIGARWVQVILSRLGYYTMNIDSKYGQGTDDAVRAFQRAYGFVERDYVTLGVARAMIEAYYAAGGDMGRLK